MITVLISSRRIEIRDGKLVATHRSPLVERRGKGSVESGGATVTPVVSASASLVS